MVAKPRVKEIVPIPQSSSSKIIDGSKTSLKDERFTHVSSSSKIIDGSKTPRHVDYIT